MNAASRRPSGMEETRVSIHSEMVIGAHSDNVVCSIFCKRDGLQDPIPFLRDRCLISV